MVNKIHKVKAYFLMVNMMLAIFGFSYLVSAQSSGSNNINTGPGVQVYEYDQFQQQQPFNDGTSGSAGGPSTTPNPIGGGAGGGSVLPSSQTPPSSGAVLPSGQTPPSQVPNEGGIPQPPAGGGNNAASNNAAAAAPGLLGGLGGFFNQGFLTSIAMFTGVGAAVGGALGGGEGAKAGAIAGIAGAAATQAIKTFAPNSNFAFLGGIAVAAGVFLFLYKEESTEIVDFSCLPYEPPIGGNDCELCNEFEECSQYMCKSLGQACDIINEGTEDVKCVWINPRDVNSPRIEFKEVSDGHEFRPDNSVRPPATGVEISQSNGNCLKAFTPLEFTFITDEPAQCKIDYNITTDYESMNFFVGGSNIFDINHTEVLSLPGANVNFTSPQLQNDGEYSLFVRCQDANGNFNQDPFSVKFCVEEGPDTTPPRIEAVNVPSGNPIKFNQTNFDLEVYVNEPSECKWSRSDISYDNMEHEMNCDTQFFQINNQNLFTCRAELTGIEDRKENKYYFRCKDQPFKPESERNVNIQSFLYTLIGTQPLNILSVSPDGEEIFGSTNVIPVFIEVETDNGYNEGESICYYNTVGFEADFLKFLETDSNKHVQRQDLPTGDYDYYIKCVDLGGNADFSQISFSVETDRQSPVVVRVYKEFGQLKIITHEQAECSYSHNDCNFEIESGIEMTSSLDFRSHTADLRNSVYNIKCKDQYNNQPNPTDCSIKVRPSSDTSSDVIVL